MRHGTSSSRRQRNNRGGSGRRGGGNNNRMQVYDSNGPDVRIRGTAHQVCEKYLTLAKDSAVSGNIVLSESYMQHAEHYQRLINEHAEKTPAVHSNKVEEKSSENKVAPKSDDLSLPNSILGDSPKAKEATGTAECTSELSPAE